VAKFRNHAARSDEFALVTSTDGSDNKRSGNAVLCLPALNHQVGCEGIGISLRVVLFVFRVSDS
jgi:hypothetical protein